MNNKSSIRSEKEFLAKINVQSILNDRLNVYMFIKNVKKYTSNTFLVAFLVFVLMLTFGKHIPALFFVLRNCN